MKSFKVLSIFFAIFFLGTNITSAQSQEMELTDEQKEEMAQNLEEFNEVLNLSEEQKTEFAAITKKYAKQMLTVKQEGGSKMSMYKKVKSIRKDRNKEMKEVLSEEQYDVYLKKQKEMQKKMKEKRG
ncbi:MAG: hypothetical protein AAFO07_26780 [Bacteroidota bacterium]